MCRKYFGTSYILILAALMISPDIYEINANDIKYSVETFQVGTKVPLSDSFIIKTKPITGIEPGTILVNRSETLNPVGV